MLRTAGNRFTNKASLKKLASSRRGFSSTPQPKPQSPILTSKRQPDGGDFSPIMALLGIVTIFGLPVYYIKKEKIQLDSQVENIIGTLLGTSTVLYLRPDRDFKGNIDLSYGETADGATGSKEGSSEEHSESSSSSVKESGSNGADGSNSSATSSDLSSGLSSNILGSNAGGAADTHTNKGEGKAEDLVCPLPQKKTQDAIVTTAGAAGGSNASGSSDENSLVCPIPQKITGSSGSVAVVDAKELASSHSKEHSSGGAATPAGSSSGTTDAVCPMPQSKAAGAGAGAGGDAVGNSTSKSSTDSSSASKAGVFYYLFWKE
jgi:hypothetical protein